MDIPADDTPPQGIIKQLPEPAVATVEVTPAAMTPMDDSVTLVSVHPQLTQFPASVTRVASCLWSSSFLSSIALVSLFIIVITVLVGYAMGFLALSDSLSAGWDNLPTLFVEVSIPSIPLSQAQWKCIWEAKLDWASGLVGYPSIETGRAWQKPRGEFYISFCRILPHCSSCSNGRCAITSFRKPVMQRCRSALEVIRRHSISIAGT